MSKLRVLMLTHTNLIPPDDIKDMDDPRLNDCRSEYDVKNSLLHLGHEVNIVGIEDDITPIRQAIEDWKPHIAFNMMEAFANDGALDYYIVSYLDMVGLPYTGCNPRGMLLARDKSLSKKLLSFHRVRVPKFVVFPRGRKGSTKKADARPYPMIVKSTVEQGSVGIAQASYVNSPEELIERVEQLFAIAEGDAIAEQYIEGRELYVAVLGNTRLQVLPIRELVFDKIDEGMHRIATYSVKWNEKYRERWGIDYQFARNLPAGMAEKINNLAKRVYRILDLNSYARLDLRLTEDGRLFVLEANPNAAISTEDDVAFSAERAGIMYDALIQKILNLGLRYRREMRE